MISRKKFHKMFCLCLEALSNSLPTSSKSNLSVRSLWMWRIISLTWLIVDHRKVLILRRVLNECSLMVFVAGIARISDVTVQIWRSKDLSVSDIAFSCFNREKKIIPAHLERKIGCQDVKLYLQLLLAQIFFVELCHKVKVFFIICLFAVLTRRLSRVLYTW